MRERENVFASIDWWTVGLYLLLVFMGWINIYAAVFNEENSSIFSLVESYGKQLLWIGTSIALAIIVLLVDVKVYSTFSYFIYLIVVLTLVGVLLFGKEVAGARSWFQIGSFSIQPSEFAKFATSLALARFLSQLGVSVRNIDIQLKAGLLIFFPAFLILLQNDTGSALVYVAFVLVLFREGMSGLIIIIGVCTAILFVMTLLINKFIVIAILVVVSLSIFFLIKKRKRSLKKLFLVIVAGLLIVFSVDYAFHNVLEHHQRTRINVLLGLESDPYGAGYNVRQSLIAIGSGGFSGKGFLNGTQTKYDFVPEQNTDFIFCTIGEEWGFIGSFIVIGLFVTLLLRIINRAEKQRSSFSRIYGYCVASIIFFHLMVNVGMAIGLLPVIGIPLPFFSYGGSSLWSFTLLLFIFIKQDAHRLDLL